MSFPLNTEEKAYIRKHDNGRLVGSRYFRRGFLVPGVNGDQPMDAPAFAAHVAAHFPRLRELTVAGVQQRVNDLLSHGRHRLLHRRRTSPAPRVASVVRPQIVSTAVHRMTITKDTPLPVTLESTAPIRMVR